MFYIFFNAVYSCDVKADSLMNRKKQINVLINLMLIQFF